MVKLNKEELNECVGGNPTSYYSNFILFKNTVTGQNYYAQYVTVLSPSKTFLYYWGDTGTATLQTTQYVASANNTHNVSLTNSNGQGVSTLGTLAYLTTYDAATNTIGTSGLDPNSTYATENGVQGLIGTYWNQIGAGTYLPDGASFVASGAGVAIIHPAMAHAFA